MVVWMQRLLQMSWTKIDSSKCFRASSFRNHRIDLLHWPYHRLCRFAHWEIIHGQSIHGRELFVTISGAENQSVRMAGLKTPISVNCFTYFAGIHVPVEDIVADLHGLVLILASGEALAEALWRVGQHWAVCVLCLGISEVMFLETIGHD